MLQKNRLTMVEKTMPKVGIKNHLIHLPKKQMAIPKIWIKPMIKAVLKVKIPILPNPKTKKMIKTRTTPRIRNWADEVVEEETVEEDNVVKNVKCKMHHLLIIC